MPLILVIVSYLLTALLHYIEWQLHLKTYPDLKYQCWMLILLALLWGVVVPVAIIVKCYRLAKRIFRNDNDKDNSTDHQ
jgi:hypothetical protein